MNRNPITFGLFLFTGIILGLFLLGKTVFYIETSFDESQDEVHYYIEE